MENDIESEISNLITTSMMKFTISDISFAIFGTASPSSCRKVHRYLTKLVECGYISKERVPGSQQFIYGKTGASLETDVCDICLAIKNVSDLRNGVCEACCDLMEQSAPSVPDHIVKIAPRISKIDHAFLRETKYPDADSIYNMFVGLDVKIMIKNSDQIVYGKVVKIVPNHIKLQTSYGPAMVSKEAIASIGCTK